MKVFKILSHPYSLIFCFLFILISGEHWGGFYATYILTALPSGRLQSLFAVSGIVILLFSYYRYNKDSRYNLMNALLNVLGVLFLLVSLVVFFKRDTAHYNWSTFDESLPLFTLYFTAFIALCFLIGTFWRPMPKADDKHGFLSKL